MDLSGVIFVVLAVAWAVFLIPKALQHHDQVARTRSVDRFSGALRVLARREPVGKRDARLVVSSTTRVRTRVVETEVTESEVTESEDAAVTTDEVVPSPARLRARRQAAKVAARRRRRILALLLLATIATTTAAALAHVPWWSVAIPGGLTLLWLVLCRTQVRGESRAVVRRPAAAPPQERQETQEAVEAPVHVEEVAPDRVADFDDEREDTIGIPVALLDAVAIPTEDGGTLWDPLPVTLPTYVTKPKAKRTVRTIDLGEPGTWTSGRTAEDSRIAADAQAAETAPGQGDEGVEGARAVGS